MGFEQTSIQLQQQQQQQQHKPLIGTTNNGAIEKHIGILNRDNIILNSFSLAIVFIISIYLSFIVNYFTTYDLSILGSLLYSFYSIPICFFVPFVISKLRVKHSLIGVMSLTFILHLLIIYTDVEFVTVLSLILLPILTEILIISIGSYLISFSTKLNVGLSFGIFTGIPFIILNILSLRLENIEYGIFGMVVIGLILFTISIILITLLSKSANFSNCDNENVEKSNGLLTIISVLGSNDFTYFIPIAIHIGFIYDYSSISEYGTRFMPEYYFIVGIIGGISAVIFGVILDKLCNNKSKLLLKIIFIIGMIAYFINFIYVVGQNRINFNLDTGLGDTALTLNSISSSCLIVFIFSIGSILFKNNSISFVSSIRLLQVIGSIIISSYQYWAITKPLEYFNIFSTYFSPLIYLIGCILLIILISKRINSHNSSGYSQIV